MVNGKTEVFGILGDPIHQVSTPELINRIFRDRKENKVLIPYHVDKDSLNEVIEGLKRIKNFRGAVITMPHKSRVVKLLDSATKEVHQVKACNVIKRTANGEIIGDMLDGKGFIKGLEKSNFNIEGKSVFLIGSGGVASGIAYALCRNGIKNLSIFNRTKEKADQLINSLRTVFPEINIGFSSKITNDLDLLINGTSVGMNQDDDLPISFCSLNSNTLVAEVIIRPEITITLKTAQEKGCKIHKGIHMLESQIELMIEFMK